MATAQSVIKKFMQSLDNTSQLGIAAVDEAIRAASDGRFYSMRDVFNGFTRDASGLLASDSNANDDQVKTFLKQYCDIDLDNDDTGAISGLDAGGSSTAKTAESVIPDTPSTLDYTDSYTVQGVTFRVSNSASLTDNQKLMCKCIQNWWLKNSLSVIEQSYGLRFDETGAKIKEVNIKFTRPEGYQDERWNSILACVYWYTDEPSLDLCINMDDLILQTSQNGKSNYNGVMQRLSDETFEEYFDRTLTHELVHAVMNATIDNVWELPASIKEGMAELIHGIDDVRKNSIYNVLKSYTPDEWWSDLLTRTTTYASDYTYAAGYVFLRYLAKQLSTSANSPAVKTYDKSGKTVTFGANFATNTIELSKEKDAIHTKLQHVDARAVKQAVNIHGDGGANELSAGSKGGTLRGYAGNDTLYGGASKDTFYYTNGDGNDTIKNYGSGVDVIQLASGSVTATQISGYDLILKVGKGSIRIADGTTKNILLKEGSKAIRTIKGYKKLPAIATYNTDQSAVTLKATAKGTFDARSYNTTIRTIDGRAASAAVNIYGNAAANAIYAGKKGGILRGFGGNDTLYGGAGTDTFYYANGDGNDVINKYESNKDIIQLGSASINKTAVYGDDVTFTIGKGTIKVAGGAGKTFRIKDAKGKIITKRVDYRALPKGASYGANYTKVTLSSAFTGTFDGRAYRGSVRTIDGRSIKARAINIYGTNGANTIYAGRKGGILRGFGGNDTLYGSSGTDTFYYANGDGNDVINNYESNKDIIQLGSGSISKTTVYGSDVTFTIGKGTIKVIGGAGKTFRFKDAKGKLSMKRVDYRALPSGGAYTSNYTKVTLAAGFTGTFEAKAYRPTIQTVDASKATKTVTLYGNSKANRLVAGKGGSVLRGFGGDDTLVGGAGEDKFYFGKGDGNLTIENYDSLKDRIVLYDSNSYNYSGNASTNTISLKTNTGKTVTIRGGFGKWINITGANGGKQSFRMYREHILKASDKGVFKVSEQSAGTSDIDASQSPYATTLYGTAGDNDFTASQGGSQIYAGNGRDTIHCNNGKDTIYLNRNGYGRTDIYNLQKNDILYLQGVSGVSDFTTNVENGILSLNFKGGNMQAQVMGWKQGQSCQLIYGNDSSHRLHTVTTSGNRVTISN